MNTFILKNTAAESIATEIRFNVASERARKAEIMKLSVSGELADDKRQKLTLNAQKVLRAMKKQGRIQLFATPGDFKESTTEAQYLMNKYPEVDFFGADEEYFIIVRI